MGKGSREPGLRETRRKTGKREHTAGKHSLHESPLDLGRDWPNGLHSANAAAAENLSAGTDSLRTREKIDPAPTALPWGGCKMIGRPAGARCRASGEARRQSKFGDFSIFYFFTDSHGSGSVTLAKTAPTPSESVKNCLDEPWNLPFRMG